MVLIARITRSRIRSYCLTVTETSQYILKYKYVAKFHASTLTRDSNVIRSYNLSNFQSQNSVISKRDYLYSVYYKPENCVNLHLTLKVFFLPEHFNGIFIHI